MSGETLKLTNIRTITATLHLESGLHIGAGDTELRIGGTDKPVVKHPHTNEPYIPGSSIKGKVRSLLELKSGLLARTGDGKPLGVSVLNGLSQNEKKMAMNILKLFGVSGADDQTTAAIGPSRASFADCPLSEDSRQLASNLSLFEIKAENSINRIRGAADSPRFIERVAAGLAFDFAVSLKEFEGDNGLFDLLLEGLKLLQHDALGGSGSRGYGRVRFKFHDAEVTDRFKKALTFERGGP